MSNQKKESLFSKIKTFCEIRRIPFIIVPVILFAIVAIIALCIGGTIAGWNIGKALTSKSAILVYAILVVVAIIVAFKVISARNRR